MVRRSAAVLATPYTAWLAGLAWFLAAPGLPELRDSDGALILAAAVGIAAVLGCVRVVAPLTQTPLALALVVPGAILIVGALAAAGVGAAATPAEALLYGALGALFAALLGTPALALALPVVVAGVDAAVVLGSDAGALLHDRAVETGDSLTLELPAIGFELPAGRLGLSDVVFAGILAGFAYRLELRAEATVVAVAVAAIAAYAAGVLFDRAVPAIPAMAIAYFLVNAQQLPALLGRVDEG